MANVLVLLHVSEQVRFFFYRPVVVLPAVLLYSICFCQFETHFLSLSFLTRTHAHVLFFIILSPPPSIRHTSASKRLCARRRASATPSTLRSSAVYFQTTKRHCANSGRNVSTLASPCTRYGIGHASHHLTANGAQHVASLSCWRLNPSIFYIILFFFDSLVLLGG